MSLTNTNELTNLCRLCLSDCAEVFYKLDSDFSILVMESGSSVTIADALKYLALEVNVPPLETENPEGTSESEEPKPDPEEDDRSLPKSLCQTCLEQLQTSYEFKFRCEENRTFLRNYLKECAESKLAAERAVKEAAMAALDIDIDNLDNLPDKLVLKKFDKEKKPRKPRDNKKATTVRRRRIPEKNVVIAENSQVDSAIYVRKLVSASTPDQSPEVKKVNKRKSQHVIIEDVYIGGKKSKPKEEKPPKENFSESVNSSKDEMDEKIVKEEKKSPKEDKSIKKKSNKQIVRDSEPEFEEDIEFEDEPAPKKRATRSKK